MGEMNDTYRTSDTGLAAYLLLLNHTCIGAIPVEDDDRRYDFVFIGIENPAILAQQFQENKAVGKLKDYRKKLQFLNHILRSEKITPDQLEQLKND